MVTLKSTDLLYDLIDFLEFKEWQKARIGPPGEDRRDGGEKNLNLIKSFYYFINDYMGNF